MGYCFLSTELAELRNYFFDKNVLKGLSRNSVAKRRSKDAQREILLTWKRASPLIEFQNNINFQD